MSDAQKCTATRKDGTPCKAYASKEGDPTLCFYHDPALEEKRARARRQGGMTATLNRREERQEAIAQLELPDEIQSQEDANRMVSRMAILVAKGVVPREIGDTVTRMAREYRQGRKDVQEEKQIQERVEKLAQNLESLREENRRLKDTLDRHDIAH